MYKTLLDACSYYFLRNNQVLARWGSTLLRPLKKFALGRITVLIMEVFELTGTGPSILLVLQVQYYGKEQAYNNYC